MKYSIWHLINNPIHQNVGAWRWLTTTTSNWETHWDTYLQRGDLTDIICLQETNGLCHTNALTEALKEGTIWSPERYGTIIKRKQINNSMKDLEQKLENNSTIYGIAHNNTEIHLLVATPELANTITSLNLKFQGFPITAEYGHNMLLRGT